MVTYLLICLLREATAIIFKSLLNLKSCIELVQKICIWFIIICALFYLTYLMFWAGFYHVIKLIPNERHSVT